MRVITWNCGNAPPPQSLGALFEPLQGQDAGSLPDLVIVGQQESAHRLGGAEGVEDWSNSSRSLHIVKTKIGGDTALNDFWAGRMGEALGQEEYYLVKQTSLCEMRLTVFARRRLRGVIPVAEVQHADEAAGIAHVVGNKGGLLVKLRVFGARPALFAPRPVRSALLTS